MTAPAWRRWCSDLDDFKRLYELPTATGRRRRPARGGAVADGHRPAGRRLARTGGEELVVLGLVGDPDEASRLAERLRLAVAGAAPPTVTASIGVALTRPADGEDPTAALWRLIDRADAAMYEAKQAGRDRVSTPGLRRPAPPSDVSLAVPLPPACDSRLTHGRSVQGSSLDR